MTTYVSQIREVTYAQGQCNEQVVTLSLFENPDTGYRCVVRQWLTPSYFGPPGVVVFSVMRGFTSLANYVDPKGDTSNIQIAAEAILRKTLEVEQTP